MNESSFDVGTSLVTEMSERPVAAPAVPPESVLGRLHRRYGAGNTQTIQEQTFSAVRSASDPNFWFQFGLVWRRLAEISGNAHRSEYIEKARTCIGRADIARDRSRARPATAAPEPESDVADDAQPDRHGPAVGP